jgi:class 3 adenylate cyclase
MSEPNEPAGHPMDEIAQRFNRQTGPASADHPESKTASASDLSIPADADTSDIESTPSVEALIGPLSFSPDQIAGPAFFVDKKLSIRWVAPGASDAFSQALARELESESTRNVFHLLLKPAVKGSLSDWQTFFSFVYILLRRLTSRDTFDTETVSISKDQTPTVDNGTTGLSDVHPFQVESCMLGGNEPATEPPLRIFGIAFEAGTLFQIRQDLWHPMMTGEREAASVADPIDPADEKKAICILSARLNDSHRIADTMLPDVFFKLMNRIWDDADDVARSLGGIRAGSRGAEILYMFTKNAGRNPIFSAITCATRLNSHIRTLQEKLKPEEGWADEICVNIGISHGTDDLTAPEPSGAMELMMPGGASDQSSLLSTLGTKGDIWITKNAVGQLPKKLIDQVVLGIDRQGQFFRNFFTRLSDLSPGIGASQSKGEMGALSIARIVKIEKANRISR